LPEFDVVGEMEEFEEDGDSAGAARMFVVEGVEGEGFEVGW